MDICMSKNDIKIDQKDMYQIHNNGYLYQGEGEGTGSALSVGTLALLVMLHFFKKKINISQCLLLLLLSNRSIGI